MIKLNNIFFTMRNFLFFLALLFTLPAFTQLRFDYPITDIEPAEIIITYSLKYQKDSLNPNFIQQDDMLLFLGHNVSKFLSSNLYSYDTIMRQISSMTEFQEFLLDPHRPFPRIGYRIYKNYPKGKLTYIEHIPSSTFKYEESIKLFNWQLSGDTVTISGYKAQKATCDFGGRSWIAWFSPEIPYSDGPYKFNGLPGLIVKVSDTRNHYVFELEFIEKPAHKLMIDLREKDFVETTKKDFFRAKDAFYNNIISRAKDAGLSSEVQQKAARKAAERNNPIELKRK